MSAQITLDANETAKVNISIPTSSNVNKIYYAAHARIYYAYSGTKKWSYAGLQGALVFVLNTSSNALHFQLVDLDGDGGVIWDYELHDGLVLDQEKSVTFFLSFEGNIEGNKRMIGFVFVDDSEAKTFYNHVKNNKDTKSSKPKRSSWIKSISKGGSNIDKSIISRPTEDGFVHVAHMGYDADSGFTSKGVDPSWMTFLESPLGKEVVANEINYSEQQHEEKPPPPPPRNRSQNGAPTPPSRPAARNQPLPMAPHRSISLVVEDEQSPPPPPPRRPTPPTHGRPAPPVRPLPPQPEELPLPRETEPKQTTAGIPYSRPRYSKSPPSPLVLSHGSSRNWSISPSISPSRSTPTGSTGALIQRQESQRNQAVDLPSPTSEAASEHEAAFDITQTAQCASQRSWILPSRIPRAPKKTMDAQFIAYMVDRRRQTNDSDASSTSSTAGVSWIGLRGSIASSAFSPSFSVASPPPGAEFPPTPVFKDEFPEEIMQKVKSSPLYSSMSRGFIDRS